MNLPDVIGWVVLGLLAGAFARALVPGDDRAGCLVTLALGIAGAFVGGWVGRYTGLLSDAQVHPWIPSLGSLVTATVGAAILLLLFRLVRK